MSQSEGKMCKQIHSGDLWWHITWYDSIFMPLSLLHGLCCL